MTENILGLASPISGDVISRLTTIIESAPTAIVMVNKTGSIVLVNREVEILFGYTRKELLGQTVEIFVPPRFRDAHPGMRDGFFANPQARRMGAGRELYGARKDGSEFPVEIGLNPVNTENGVFVLSAIVDITERKRSEELFRATIESAPTAMIMINLEGVIVLANAETMRLFGYQNAELLGKTIEILVPERFRHAHPGMRRGFFASPHARRMGAGRDLFGVRKDGSEFPIEIGLNPVETQNGSFVLSAIVDITERKRMEDKLRGMNDELESRVKERTAQLAMTNEAMERSNMELQQFAYIASHDLQAPLRSISGFVQMLEKDYGGKIDARATEWIRRTVENTKFMQTLIQDLLSYSQVESRARPFAPVAFSEVMSEAVSVLEGSITDAQAVITSGELPTVIGDKSQLVQLMLNLIANGIKYHGDETPKVHVTAEKKSGEWLFAVRDNGIGIPPKHHEKIFEIFRRLHTRQAYPGTGIGLAVCRRVVHRHDGKIWVESSAGEGSVFYFTLPERKAEA